MVARSGFFTPAGSFLEVQSPERPSFGIEAAGFQRALDGRIAWVDLGREAADATAPGVLD